MTTAEVVADFYKATDFEVNATPYNMAREMETREGRHGIIVDALGVLADGWSPEEAKAAAVNVIYAMADC